jgi:hypothetical protein
MFRFLFRFIGLWLLAGAFVALVIDGTRSITASRFVVVPLGAAWETIHPGSIEWLKTFVERDLSLRLWDPVLLTILNAPLWVALAVLGAILVALGRRRPRPIGYSSRD